METAINQVGSISIQSGVGGLLSSSANLVAEFVFARVADGDNAIELVASGVGSDVVVGRVFAAGRLGGVVLTADDDVRSFAVDGEVDNLVAANELTVTAGNNESGFDGVFLAQTSVRSFNAVVSGTDQAQIFINNQGAVNVTNLSLQTGTISFNNFNGNLNVSNAIIQNDSGDGLISLRTEGDGSDLRVGNVSARGAEGVFLNAADDIFDFSFLDDVFIDADFLSAISNNNFDDDDLNGIFVSGDIDDISQQALNGGQFFFADRS